MPGKCVALLSGGLDSILAIRIMQEHEVEVEALNFKTVFTCCQDQSGQAARELGVRLTIVGQDDDYLDLVRNPRFGYGKGANPCVDCRIYMFQKAKRFMEQVDAQFIVSGEVLGQRPMSQKRRDLDVISYHSNLEDILLRPLSAKLLPPTKPERERLVDRRRLYGIVGRGRKPLIELAKQFGLKDIPTPSTGCALTEPMFAKKVFDLIKLTPESSRWDFEILKVGRHFRLDNATKVVVGRNQDDNRQLEFLHEMPNACSTALLTPNNFRGPLALLMGPLTDAAVEYAVGLITRYSNPLGNTDPRLVKVDSRAHSRVVQASVTDTAQQASTLASA